MFSWFVFSFRGGLWFWVVRAFHASPMPHIDTKNSITCAAVFGYKKGMPARGRFPLGFSVRVGFFKAFRRSLSLS